MRAFLLGAAVLALAACGSDKPDDPVDPVDPTDDTDPPDPEERSRDYDELAQIISAHVRGEFPLQLQAAEISESRMPQGFALTNSSLEMNEGTGAGGASSYQYSFWCNDGSQMHIKVPCDGNAHHSHIKFNITGSQTVGSMTLTEINRVVDWEIRDIMMDKARFRGPDAIAFKTSVTTAGVTAAYGVQFTAVYEQVRFMPAETIPTFGTIDFTINTERTRGSDRRVFNSTAKLTYLDGLPAALVLDTNTYNLDLTSGAVVKL